VVTARANKCVDRLFSACWPTPNLAAATFADLAAGFGISTATAWRYATETVALLAARFPKPRKALREAKKTSHA